MAYKQNPQALADFQALVAAEAIRAAAEHRPPIPYWLDDSLDPFETLRDAEVFGEALAANRKRREEAARRKESLP